MKYTKEHLQAMGVNGKVAEILIDLINRVERLEELRNVDVPWLQWQIDGQNKEVDTESK